MQIVSDIHLEFMSRDSRNNFTLTPHAKYLALLGDIGDPNAEYYWEFIRKQSKQFKDVFLIAGNHEYYSGGPMQNVAQKIRRKCHEFPNVHFLDNETYILKVDEEGKQYQLIGSTLWSCISRNNFKRFNDSYFISGMDFDVYHQLHRDAVRFITRTLEMEDEFPSIILTHHGNITEMSGKYVGKSMEDAFVSNLTHLLDLAQYNIHAWASGHVHSNVDIIKNGVRCVSNALGYAHEIEEIGFQENVVIDL